MQRIQRWRRVVSLVILGTTLVVPGVRAEEETVSIEEFRKLKAEQEQLKREVQQLKELLVKERRVATSAAPPEAEYVPVEEFEKLREEVAAARPGLTNFVVTGYAAAGYTDAQRSDSNFTANFNPIFLWKPHERVLFEGEIEMELEDGATKTDLEYAHLTYLLNDYMTLGAGKFLSPFGIFRERLHPSWINKLPDAPLGYASGADRLAPPTQIGAQVRGAIPLWPAAKTTYALWLSNGPTLQTGASNAGQLAFKNTDDNNNNKAFGWRVGLVPIPELEVGYSGQIARVGSSGSAFDQVDAFLQGADFSYVRDSEFLKGTVDLRSEWIGSDVDSADYGTSGGRFQNERSAWYAQGAYRPSKVRWPFIKNLEPVVRFDKVDHPSAAPSNVDQERWTFGLNYWLTPQTVLKGAYRIADKKEGSADEDAVLLQAAMGF